MGLPAQAIRLLSQWQAPDAAQELLRVEYLRFLDDHPDGAWRDGPPTHLTASCFVVDVTGTRTLLSHHRKGGFWVQFGGHCEPGDVDLAAAALREGREESGLSTLQLWSDPGLGTHLPTRPGAAGDPVPVDLDAHDLSAAFGRCVRHLDVAFVAVADPGEVPRVSAESLDVAWFSLDDLPADVAADLPDRLASVVRRLAQQPGPFRSAPKDPEDSAASSPARNPRARSVRG